MDSVISQQCKESLMCELYKLSSKLCNYRPAKSVHLCALNDYSLNKQKNEKNNKHSRPFSADA